MGVMEWRHLDASSCSRLYCKSLTELGMDPDVLSDPLRLWKIIDLQPLTSSSCVGWSKKCFAIWERDLGALLLVVTSVSAIQDACSNFSNQNQQQINKCNMSAVFPSSLFDDCRYLPGKPPLSIVKYPCPSKHQNPYNMVSQARPYIW